MTNNRKIFSVGDMFAGIGGIALGFQEAGFSISWANEFDKKACITYKNNFDHCLLEEDVRLLKPSELPKVDVITAGFPCQAFSVAGYRRGFEDPRGNLFFEIAKFIDYMRPKAFLLENVKNLLTHNNSNTLATIKNVIENDLGYSFNYCMLSAHKHGNIPQSRERLYMVGFKDKEHRDVFFRPPIRLKLDSKIEDFLEKGKQDDKYYFTKDHKYIPQLEEVMKRRDTLYQWRRVYVRENKQNLCPTLTANMGTGGHNVPLLVDDYGYRRLIPKECFRFQGFPDNFCLPAALPDSALYKQVGNSVVVPVIARLAKIISRILREELRGF